VSPPYFLEVLTMFDWLARSLRKDASPRTRSVRPSLEALETRDCPSFLTLSVNYGHQRDVTLSGKLSGTPTPAGQSVQLSGEVNGTAITDANGNYSLTLQAAGLGQVLAQTADHLSNIARAILYDNAPMISSFFGVEGADDVWTFTGTVNYRDPLGLTIDFGGIRSLNGQTTTVDSTGHFSFTIQLDGTSWDNGTVTAMTTDWWGLQSNMAEDYIHQT
jgi:hypothetical protein